MNSQAVYEALKDDFTAMLSPVSAERPVEGVLVLLPMESGEDMVLDVMFMPGMDQQSKYLELLQFYVQLPIDLGTGPSDALRALLLKININLPLPGFGLREEEGDLYFKYMLGLPRGGTPDFGGVLLETVTLIAHQLKLFGPPIRATAGWGPQTL